MTAASHNTYNRVLYFDVLNVIACFGVVAMHFNGLTHAYSLTWDWVQAFSIDCLFYWAVPVFFMLSGATLIDYPDKYSTKEFFKKRFTRIFIPFLMWSVIALIWKTLTGQIEPPAGPRSLISLIFNTQIIDIYWFFIPLFIVYLCIPVLARLRHDRTTLWYMVLVGVLINILFPFLSEMCGVTWNQSAQFPLASGYLIYAILGYLLYHQVLNRSTRFVIYILGVVGLLFRFIHTIASSALSGSFVQTSWGYENLPCFIESVAVFVLFSQIRWDKLFNSEKRTVFLSKVAGCSFGVYLIHMIVFWYGLAVTGLDGGDVEWRLIGPFAAYLICVALVVITKKIPFLRRLVP